MTKISLKKNILANFAGSAWAALMALAFIPLYIQLMGVESYAIVGVFSSMMAMLAVLDLGLSQAMNREMARYSSDKDSFRRMGDTARTLEVVYWAVAFIVGGIVFFLASPIAEYWLKPEQLRRDDLEHSLQIMGGVIALRWPVSLYVGGLNGLQRQVQVNVWQSLVATVQGVGALGVLWFVAPTIHVFFAWQIIVAIIQVYILRTLMWRSLPHGVTGSFDRIILKNIWRFAAGMSGISLLATVLTQLDKIILSNILTLSDFGYYVFASTVAAILFKLVGPVFTAYYPSLTALVTKNDQLEMANMYHKACQLMTISILPVALVLVFFSKEVLQIWSSDDALVLHASLLISLLAMGNLLNGLMHLPYALQLAHGWTGLAFFQNLVAVIVMAPSTYFVAERWGAQGAAFLWVLLNVGYFLISINIMHFRLLKNEKWNWYFGDVIKPSAAIVVPFIFSISIIDNETGYWRSIAILVVTLLFSTFAGVAGSTTMRPIFIRLFNK